MRRGKASSLETSFALGFNIRKVDLIVRVVIKSVFMRRHDGSSAARATFKRCRWVDVTFSGARQLPRPVTPQGLATNVDRLSLSCLVSRPAERRLCGWSMLSFLAPSGRQGFRTLRASATSSQCLVACRSARRKQSSAVLHSLPGGSRNGEAVNQTSSGF